MGLIGHFGTGKDTVAQYLRVRHGYSVVSMYEPLKTLAEKLCFPQDRTTIYELGKSLSDAFGRDLFIWWCGSRLKGATGTVLVKDARFINEVVWLSRLARVVIYIASDPRDALQRIRLRARPGDPQTIEDLKAMWDREGELDQIGSLGLGNLVVVHNSGDLESLYRAVDAVLGRWLGGSSG